MYCWVSSASCLTYISCQKLLSERWENHSGADPQKHKGTIFIDTLYRKYVKQIERWKEVKTENKTQGIWSYTHKVLFYPKQQAVSGNETGGFCLRGQSRKRDLSPNAAVATGSQYVCVWLKKILKRRHPCVCSRLMRAENRICVWNRRGRL